jgi:NodT family efflux transporter outer membrane factor (OMF) lipoprotein
MNSLQQKVQNGVSGLVLALGLQACAVGPDYRVPTTQLIPYHNTALPGAMAGAPSPPLDRWWTGFGDPMLVTIINRALSQNLELAAAYARVQQARAAASGAGAELLPTLDLDGSASATHESLRGPFGALSATSPGFKRDFNDFAVGPAASWEIDLFGGLRRSAAAARAEAQAVQADQVGTRITVVADAADAYFQVRGYQARLAIAQNQIETDEHLLRLVDARYEAGAAQGREVAQADALLKQAQAIVPPLRIGLERQLNRLDVLMSAQPGTYAHELVVVREVPAIPPIPPDEQPSDVLRRRPDVIAAERRLAAANERIGASLSDYYPKISLSGALGYDNSSGGHLLRPDAFQSVGAGAIRWRLFDFGKVDAEVSQARGANAEALALYRQAVLHAAEDVENALVTLAQTQAHVLQLQEQVSSLLKARDLSEQAYRAGSITLTDVLDADRQLLAARDELEDNRAGAARAAVGVFRAFGGGWDPGSWRSATTVVRK